MSKNIQIPASLFFDIAKYFLIDDCNSDADTYNAIQKGLTTKLDAMMARQHYTNMHNTSLSDADRNKARQAYLDAKGIHPDFRW